MDRREQIRLADQLHSERVPMPAWGLTVELRSLTIPEHIAYETWRDEGYREGDTVPADEAFAKYLICCARDEQGGLLFQREDYDWLRVKPFAAMKPLIDALAKIRSGTPEAIEAAKKD